MQHIGGNSEFEPERGFRASPVLAVLEAFCFPGVPGFMMSMDPQAVVMEP